MNVLRKLSREAQVVLGGSVIYLLLSFLDWQKQCFSGGGVSVCGGQSEWHGVGVLGGLVAAALVAWEVVRLLEIKIELGPVTPGFASAALAALLLVLTLITFLSHCQARSWPEWLAVVLSVVIALAAWRRGRAEGVEMPNTSRRPASAGS